jgi:hypothetical protein
VIRRYALLLVIGLLLATGSAVPTRAAPAVISYGLGWNIVSGPTGSHVNGAVGSLYALPAGATDYTASPISSPLQQCVAYWAFFPGGGSLDLPAGATYTAHCEVTQSNAGWVLIGNGSAGTAQISGVQASYTYYAASAANGGGYKSATTIPLGQGAMVYGVGTLATDGPTSP